MVGDRLPQVRPALRELDPASELGEKHDGRTKKQRDQHRTVSFVRNCVAQCCGCRQPLCRNSTVGDESPGVAGDASRQMAGTAHRMREGDQRKAVVQVG